MIPTQIGPPTNGMLPELTGTLLYTFVVTIPTLGNLEVGLHGSRNQLGDS